MRRVLVLGFLLAACMQAKTMRYVGVPTFASTDPGRVEVLEVVPEGAIVLGEVEGASEGVFGGAMSKVRAGAAELGADAIVVEARGEESIPEQPWYTREVIRAKALRLAR